MLWIESLVVESMTYLVQKSEDAACQVAGGKAKRDAHIARADSGAEWMLSEIEARTPEVEPDCRRQVLRKLALTVNRKLSGEPGPRLVTKSFDHGNEILCETIKQP